jgi:hypothetical protein
MEYWAYQYGFIKTSPSQSPVGQKEMDEESYQLLQVKDK